MDPRKATRLVERTAVGEDGRDWEQGVSEGEGGSPGVWDGSPSSGEAEDEGVEGFYVA
jgi:hypothetical protein